MAVILHAKPKNILIEKLRQHRYFCDLTLSQLEMLAEKVQCYRFEQGEIIFLDGAPTAGLWVVNEGHVKIFKTSSEGSEHIVHFVGPGDSFNDVSVMDGGPNPASAAALTQVIACNLSHEAIADAIRKDPELALCLIHSLAARARFLVNQVEELALYSVTTRVARFLVKQEVDPSFNAAAPVNRTTLASHLAIKPETLSRALSALEAAGAIATSRTSLIVQDVELLRVIAMF